MSDQPWVLRLGDDVVLETPEGTVVNGLPHKARGLAALLALMTPEPVSRTRTSSLLWPKASPEQRQASLRQAIMALRKATDGAPFLQASRTSLGLDRAHVRVERVNTDELLIHFSEPWFVLLRSSESAARQAAIEVATEGREASAVRSLEDVLEWTIRHQPNQAYGLIRDAVDLATSLPPHRALALSKELLRRGAMNHPLRGWANMLHAFALFYSVEIPVASKAFLELRVAAQNQGDAELMAMSAFFEAGSLIYLGDLDKADAVLAQSASKRTRKLSARAAIRLLHGSGLATCCRSDYRRGMKLLRRAIETAQRDGEHYEQLYAAVNMAWIAASIGLVEPARFALDAAEQVDTGDFWRFQLTADLARLHLQCSEGDPASALVLGEQATENAQRLEAAGFEMYFRESLARCHTLLGDKKRARQEIATAQRIRQQINWSTLPWDEDRLELARKGNVA